MHYIKQNCKQETNKHYRLPISNCHFVFWELFYYYYYWMLYYNYIIILIIVKQINIIIKCKLLCNVIFKCKYNNNNISKKKPKKPVNIIYC